MHQKIKHTLGKAHLAVQQYPLVLLMALIGAIAMMCYASGGYSKGSDSFLWIKISVTALLGISLMFALKMFTQRHGHQILTGITGLAFLLFFYVLLPEHPRDFTEKYAYLLIPTYILSHLLVSFIPFLGRQQELRFWQYNKNLFINIFLTAVFAGVLTGGAELAVLAVDKLFDFNFSERIYVQIFYFLSIFGSCFIFLLFNEDGLQSLERNTEYPLVLKFFTQYILIPLLLIYALILYFYAGKILINWQLPRGWVSYLILAYAILGILAILLVHPLRQEAGKSWVRLFSKIFYFTLIPLLVLLFTAIFTRIVAYGYTEPRYYVVLVSVWLAAVMVYFISVRKSTIKFIPVSLFSFGLFALVFPYFNASSVSIRSQKNELNNLLRSNELISGATIDFERKTADTVATEISDKLAYLSDRGQKTLVLSLLPPKQQHEIRKAYTKETHYILQQQFLTLFKNTYKTINPIDLQRVDIVAEPRLQTIEGYDYLLRFSDFYEEKTFKINNDHFKIRSVNGLPNPELKIIINSKEIWDVMPYIRQTVKTHRDKPGRIIHPELMVSKKTGNYEIKIIFDQITLEKTPREQIHYNGGYVLFRRMR